MGELPTKERDLLYWQTTLTALIQDAKQADPNRLQIILQQVEKTADLLRKISRERTKGNTNTVRF
jgi:hypothetical protein